MCCCGPHRWRHGVCAYGAQRVKEFRHSDFGGRYRVFGRERFFCQEEERQVQVKESSSSDDEAVPEDESAYYGSGDSDDYLTDVHAYTNDMHSYSMSIPNRFEMEDTPSGSSTRYEDPETGFVIGLSGYVNVNDETAHEMFVDADTSGKADLYTAEGDNWYVVSWREGDTIIYEKTIVTDSTIATAHLEYSTANRDMGSKIIDTLLPTFQVD